MKNLQLRQIDHWHVSFGKFSWRLIITDTNNCDIVISVYSTKVKFWECEKKMGVKNSIS